MKIVALAYNFESLGSKGRIQPFFFFKNPDSIIGSDEEIRIPKRWHTWPEVELALRIGPKHEDGEFFDAIAVANDVTAKNIDDRDDHLAFSKGMDTFLPMSPWLTDFDLDLVLLSGEMYTSVNNMGLQSGWLRDMIHSPSRAYYYISEYMKFKQGDILLMGTCLHNHYPLRDGDKVVCEIHSEKTGIAVGILHNRVVGV